MFTVSTTDDENRPFSAQGPELGVALGRLVRQLDRADVITFTIERIDVEYTPEF